MRLAARLLRGRPLALPPRLDRLVERWAGAPPRLRQAIAVGLVICGLAAVQWRIGAADRRWGGDPVDVLVATATLPVGQPPAALTRRLLPPAAVPPGAVDAVPAGAVLAFALPAGTVLTADHLHPRGPAAGLRAGERAVPIPVEESWGIVGGGWVDVWLVSGSEAPAVLVARGRPVLEVVTAQRGSTALVAIGEAELEQVTTGLGLGRVLLTHAPPPPG